MEVLSKYPAETIQYIKDCIDELSNLSVYEFQVDDFVEIDPTETKEAIRRSQISAGVGEGLFETADEYDMLFHALENCMIS